MKTKRKKPRVIKGWMIFYKGIPQTSADGYYCFPPSNKPSAIGFDVEEVEITLKPNRRARGAK